MSDNSRKYNIIKVRDDNEPIEFSKNEVQDKCKEFLFKDNNMPFWCSEKTFSALDLRGRVEPWLTSLFQSEHLSLLIGSGLTTAIQHKICGKSDNGMKKVALNSAYAKDIEEMAQKSATSAGRGDEPNFEDYVRTMCELLRGLEILKKDTQANELRAELYKIIKDFTNNISLIENQIVIGDDNAKNDAFSKLVMFLMSFASRTGTRDRLNIFTTNYDRLIEAAADIAGIYLIDRFVGSLSPVFRSSRLDIDMHYNPPGIRGEPRYLEGVVRYTKLHGSIDWINSNNHIRKIGLPFGAKNIQPYLNAPGLNANPSQIMIYPNSSKDRETTEYPYVELFRDLAGALCRPNSTLVTYGYSFGDDHINRVIKDMLTIPSTHLVVISYDDSMGRIMNSYKEWGRQNQMSLIIGPDIANIDSLVKFYLPKPAIDKTTLRMSELLRQRYEVQKPMKKEEGEHSINDLVSF